MMFVFIMFGVQPLRCMVNHLCESLDGVDYYGESHGWPHVISMYGQFGAWSNKRTRFQNKRIELIGGDERLQMW